MKNGSFESLKLFERCGCNPKSVIYRCTVLFDRSGLSGQAASRPVRLAPRLGLQRCVHQRRDLLLAGAARSTRFHLVVQSGQTRVAQIACATSTPSGGSLDTDAQPHCWLSPSANRKTICARRDSDAGKLCERAIDSNCARSAIVTFSSVAGLPTCIPEYSNFQGYSLDSTQHAKLHVGHNTSRLLKKAVF